VPLEARPLTYDVVGATRPEQVRWTPPTCHRAYEASARLGVGDACWAAASAEVVAWGVKTRSGFTVTPPVPRGDSVVAGARSWIRAAAGPVVIREPAQVVAVVDEPDRRGFAYGTLAGHPISGEEAFVVHREPDGTVWLTLRSVSGPGRGAWRLAFPLVLVAQRVYRRRYLRALVGIGAPRR
jgi:uncharacterized protein (UPF0548 family)